jgi:hypothetical protein
MLDTIKQVLVTIQSMEMKNNYCIKVAMKHCFIEVQEGLVRKCFLLKKV